MRDIHVSDKKSGKKRSRSFASTVWLSDTEYHLWKKLLNEIVTRTGSSGHVVTYKASWIGFQVWKLALDADRDFDDLEVVIQEALSQVGEDRDTARPDVPGDSLSAWANDMVMVYERIQDRDEALLRILEREGRKRFCELTRKRDPTFDPIAWMKRMSLVYSLPWSEKARRLVGAYLLEKGESPREDVIEWAYGVGLIAEERGRGAGTKTDLVKLASDEGFSGAGAYGMWAVPDGMGGIPEVDVDTFTVDNDLMEFMDVGMGEDEDTTVVV
jgi:hypothetical protein